MESRAVSFLVNFAILPIIQRSEFLSFTVILWACLNIRLELKWQQYVTTERIRALGV